MRKRVILTTVFILALLIIVVAVIGGVIVYNQNRQRESSSIIGEVSQEITEGNTTQVDFLNKYELSFDKCIEETDIASLLKIL